MTTLNSVPWVTPEDTREDRALALYDALGRFIEQLDENLFEVPSSCGKKTYTGRYGGLEESCTCPDASSNPGLAASISLCSMPPAAHLRVLRMLGAAPGPGRGRRPRRAGGLHDVPRRRARLHPVRSCGRGGVGEAARPTHRHRVRARHRGGRRQQQVGDGELIGEKRMDVEKIAERVAEASAALSAEEVLSRVEESTRTSAEELAEFAGILGEWKIAPAAVDLMIDTMTKHGLDFVRQILKGMAAKQAKKNAASRKRASGDLLGALEEDFAASG